MSVIVLNRKDLKEFECPICNTYYKKSIFQCITGHSICEECNAKVKNCPFCQNVVGITRNYTLETFVEKIQVKCDNEPCTVQVKLAKYLDHLAKCPFRVPPCKLCKEHNYDDVNEHIRQKHKNLVVENGNVPQSHQLTVSCLDWHTKMFWIKRVMDDGHMYWYAQATKKHSDKNAYYLSVAAVKSNGKQTCIECPVFMDPMENDKNMQNQVEAGFKKARTTGSRFILSVLKKDEKLSFVKSIFTPAK